MKSKDKSNNSTKGSLNESKKLSSKMTNHSKHTGYTSSDKDPTPTLFDNNSNSKFKSLKKSLSKTFSNKTQITEHCGDINQVTHHGSMKQYCVKGNDVLLRNVHYIRNEKSKMLMITVDNKSHQTDTYSILFTKDVCPFTFKDKNAFILKVYDSDKKLKNMTFQTEKDDEKLRWINKFSLDPNILYQLLNMCITEVERRRFQLGIKKRQEGKCKIKIECDILVELTNLLLNKYPLDLDNETKWTVGGLERLIQLLLNEMAQPLINFSYQANIRNLDMNKEFSVDNEARLVYNLLPSINRDMLYSILSHLERLSKYYLIVMSSPKKVLPQIRKNICKRLAPIVFRVQQNLDNNIVLTRCSETLYQLMINYNNLTEENIINDK